MIYHHHHNDLILNMVKYIVLDLIFTPEKCPLVILLSECAIRNVP